MNVSMVANMMRFGRFGPGPFEGYGLWRLASLVLWLLLLGLLGFLLLTLLRRRDAFTKTSGGGSSADAGAAPAPSPLDVAKMRYARGELTREEFELLKKDLE